MSAMKWCHVVWRWMEHVHCTSDSDFNMKQLRAAWHCTARPVHVFAPVYVLPRHCTARPVHVFAPVYVLPGTALPGRCTSLHLSTCCPTLHCPDVFAVAITLSCMSYGACHMVCGRAVTCRWSVCYCCWFVSHSVASRRQAGWLGMTSQAHTLYTVH